MLYNIIYITIFKIWFYLNDFLVVLQKSLLFGLKKKNLSTKDQIFHPYLLESTKSGFENSKKFEMK